MLAPESSEPKPKRPKHDNGKSTTKPKIEGFIAQLANASGPTVRARLGPIVTKTLLDTGNLYRPAISEDTFLKLPEEYRKLRPLKATCPTANVADVGMKVLGELEKAIPLKLGNCKNKFDLTPVGYACIDSSLRACPHAFYWENSKFRKNKDGKK